MKRKAGTGKSKKRRIIMKKKIAMSLVVASMLVFAGCGNSNNTASTVSSQTESQVESSAVSEAAESESAAEESTEEAVAEDVKSEGVMTYEEYVAADVDTEVVVETYVQAKQSWWEDKATVYTQDLDGAYFLYNMACSEEDYAKLVPGTKIKVTGYKSEWSGEVEIIDATFEIEEGTYVAPVTDVTELLGKEELIDYQNRFVSFKGMTVEAAGQDADGNDVAFLYSYDGSGTDGDDLYFNVSLNGETYTFTVESYLCDNTTEVYNAVKNLTIGDKIDMEGFLYWYNGVNPHITSVTVAE
jgi:hypothetical protein